MAGCQSQQPLEPYTIESPACARFVLLAGPHDGRGESSMAGEPMKPSRIRWMAHGRSDHMATLCHNLHTRGEKENRRLVMRPMFGTVRPGALPCKVALHGVPLMAPATHQTDRDAIVHTRVSTSK